MRINGFEQIKGFYSWVFENQQLNVRTTHISLYMFLLNQNNRNSWVEWFKCPYDLAMAGSGITNKKTYYTTLLELQDWGLIKYQKGMNNYKAPLIKIEVLFDTSTVPQSEPQLQPQVIPIPLPLLQPQLYNNIKLLTNNLKPITINIEKVLEFLNKKDFGTFEEFREKYKLYATELYQDNLWIEAVSRNHIKHSNNEVNKKTIHKYLKLFLTHLDETQEKHHNKKDFQYHFSNWLRKQTIEFATVKKEPLRHW